MHAQAHTWHMQPIIHSQQTVAMDATTLAMDATAVPHVHLFITVYLLGPTDNTDPPTSPQMRTLPPKWEAENIHAISHVLLSQFFSSSIGELSGFNQSDARFVELYEQFPEHVEWSVLDPTALSHFVELPELGSQSERSGDRLSIVFSRGVVLCGWLSSKYQLTN